MRYRQINPPVCEAVQWQKHGDHPQVKQVEFQAEGPCVTCGQGFLYHGWVEGPEGGQDGYVVCPSNYVLFTDHFYPLPAAEFLRNYAPLVSGDLAVDLKQTESELQTLIENYRERLKPRPIELTAKISVLGKKAIPALGQEERAASLYKLREALLWLREAMARC